MSEGDESLKKFNEHYNLSKNVCNSLLFNFDKVLETRGDREFTIPPNDVCEEILTSSLKDIGKMKGDYDNPCIYARKLKELKKIEPRIADAIYDSFYSVKDVQNFFEGYLFSGNFDFEFFYGFGTFFRFYPKLKIEAEKNIESFFNEKELNSLSLIGKLIKNYGDIWWEERNKS